MKRIPTLLFFFLALFTGNAFAQEDGRKKNINFRYEGKLLEQRDSSSTFPIDLDAIYYSIFVDPVFQDTIYDYIRYFPKGQLYRSGNYNHVPTQEDVETENLKKGYPGYYFIEDSVLRMEIYMDRYSGKEYFEADVNDTSIVIYQTKTMHTLDMLTAVRTDTTVYHKKSMSLPEGVTPDW